MEYDDMKKMVADNVCAQCGGELTIRSNPETGNLEIWCPHNPDHRGYVERTTWTQEYRRGEGAPLVIQDKIEKKMLPGGYSLGLALALVKTRFPRADMDEPSAALFLMDCMRLDLDPLLGEIVPVTFKVTDKETKEVTRVVQPVLTEDGWLSLCARACTERWVGPPRTYRLEDYLRTLEENEGKSLDEIKELAKEIKKDACGDEEAYYWMSWGNVKVGETVMETPPSPGWLKQKEYKKAKEAGTPAGELPGNQARVRAIKRWARENFPEAKAKMKEMTSEWMARAKDIEQVQRLIEAEYHIVTEIPEKSSEQPSKKIGDASPKTRAQAKKAETAPVRETAPAAEETPLDEAIEGEGFSIDMTWLREALGQIRWSVDTTKSFLSQYGVSIEGTLEDMLRRLTREQAEEFLKEIQERAAKNQAKLI